MVENVKSKLGFAAPQKDSRVKLGFVRRTTMLEKAVLAAHCEWGWGVGWGVVMRCQTDFAPASSVRVTLTIYCSRHN